MDNHKVMLSIDTNINREQLIEYLQNALKTFTWASLPHPHMRVAIEEITHELEVFDSRTKGNK